MLPHERYAQLVTTAALNLIFEVKEFPPEFNRPGALRSVFEKIQQIENGVGRGVILEGHGLVTDITPAPAPAPQTEAEPADPVDK